MKLKPKTLVGVLLIAGFSSLLFLNFGEQVGGYMNFAQAAETGQRAHVVGTWAKDQPVAYNRDRNVFSFSMLDDQGVLRRVEYANPKPANFEDAEKLVVDGYASGDVFVAEHILVKCPSKYNDTRSLETAGV